MIHTIFKDAEKQIEKKRKKIAFIFSATRKNK